MSSFTPILLLFIFLVMPLLFGGILEGKKIKCLSGNYHLKGGVFLKDFELERVRFCYKCGMSICANSSYAIGMANCHDAVCQRRLCNEGKDPKCELECDTDNCNDPNKLYTTTTSTTTTTVETTEEDQGSETIDDAESSTKDKGNGDGGSTRGNEGEGKDGGETRETGDGGETDETTPGGKGGNTGSGTGAGMMPESMLIGIIGGAMGLLIIADL